MPVIKKCEICGKIFTVVPSRADTAKYCSKECSGKSKQTGEDIICDNCGCTFYRRQYHIDRQANNSGHNFCCMECRSEFKHKQSIETRVCEICGGLFECSKKSTQRFCSQQCRYVWNESLVGELNNKYTKIDVKCDYCGEMYKVKPSQYSYHEHHFCSIGCRQKWYAEIYSQTDEFKDKSRIRAANILKNNPQSTNTKPQLLVNQILSDLGIKYENEYLCGYYSIDNYLIDDNLIIEVMGDYWHSNPCKYYTADRLNDTQLKRIRADKAKHTYICNYYNIEILYIWEQDIINHPDVCKSLIRKYISNNGQLDNYHSFNYSFDNNGDIVLNKIITIPYQDRKETNN